jgi:hypothetical protein
MNIILCTILDKGFLFKGMALIDSLLQSSGSYTLYVLCLDGISREILASFGYAHVKLITLAEVEDAFPQLRDVKSGRTAAEYAWTLKPFLCRHVLNAYRAHSALFLDADFCFFDDVRSISALFEGASVGIVPHNLYREKKYLEPKMGKYNAGCVYFANDASARACLQWWSERVLEWCFARYEQGKQGDQVYLNAFPEKFSGVRIIAHKGVDAAPWNVPGYRVSERDKKPYLDGDPLILFHFHAFRILSPDTFLEFHRDVFSGDVYRLIYGPYRERVRSVIRRVRENYPDFSFGFGSVGLSERAYLFLLRLPLLRSVLSRIAAIRTRILVALT